jgi:hypothetical protein
VRIRYAEMKQEHRLKKMREGDENKIRASPESVYQVASRTRGHVAFSLSPSISMFLRHLFPIPRFRCKAPFSSLSPASLTSSDWVNIAGKSQPTISFTPAAGIRSSGEASPKPTSGYLGYYSRAHSYQRAVAIPFPPDAQGFLYYTAPSGHPAGGKVRFRRTSSPDPSSFAKGSDLLLPSGIPWSTPTPAMVAKRYAPLRACLLHSHDLSPADVEGWSGSPIPAHVTARSHVISTPEDIFPINFASASGAALWIANGSNVHYVMLKRTAAIGLGGVASRHILVRICSKFLSDFSGLT